MQNLVSSFLVAVPNLGDGFYDESVVFVFRQTASYVAGLVLNKPAPTTLGALYQKVTHSPFPLGRNAYPLYLGGRPESEEESELLRAPVVLLHSSDYAAENTQPIASNVSLTGLTETVLHDFARGQTPKDLFVSCGGSFWDSDDLAREMAYGAWGLLPFDRNLLFTQARATMWEVCRSKIQERLGPDRPFAFDDRMTAPCATNRPN